MNRNKRLSRRDLIRARSALESIRSCVKLIQDERLDIGAMNLDDDNELIEAVSSLCWQVVRYAP